MRPKLDSERINKLVVALGSLKSSRLLSGDAKLRGPSDPVWSEVCEATQFSNPKYVYTIMLQNRHNVYFRVFGDHDTATCERAQSENNTRNITDTMQEQQTDSECDTIPTNDTNFYSKKYRFFKTHLFITDIFVYFVTFFCYFVTILL